jgi:hypothetical protein
MKRVIAAALTAMLMGLLLVSGLRRGSEGTRLVGRVGTSDDDTSSAEARIRALLEGAASGDVGSYLSAFTGQLRARMEREADERGRAAFAADLRRASQARKSHAVFAAEPDGTDSARVTVETVYPDHNERQTYRLERTGLGWLVTDVETVQVRRPAAKFGAAAAYLEPEGVPVQGIVVESGEAPEVAPPDRNP